jgi:hypothetical protein
MIVDDNGGVYIVFYNLSEGGAINESAYIGQQLMEFSTSSD